MVAPAEATPTEAEFGEMVTVVHAALTRNYPDLAVEQVWDGLDLRNIRAAMDAVAGASGLEAKDAAGEARAVSPSTGAS